RRRRARRGGRLELIDPLADLPRPLRIGLLASGEGTNVQAILDAGLPIVPAVVIADRPGVNVLRRAERAAVPATVVDHAAFPGREAFEEALLGVLHAHRVGLVVLAGFLRLLGPRFLAAFPLRVVNLHP